MALITESGSQTLPLGGSAPDFDLPATDGSSYSLASFAQALCIGVGAALVFSDLVLPSLLRLHRPSQARR